MRNIPAPLSVPWTLKPVDSATFSAETLADGRVKYSIEHDELRGVHPGMIVWFLNHLMDEIDMDGQRVQNYRLWHPIDHVAMTYLKPGTDGRNFGPGAQLRIQEAFQANPRYAIDVKATVEFLDETGFAHVEKMGGLKVAEMRYSFTKTEAGMLYRNSLTVGAEGRSLLARFVNSMVLPRVFPPEKGHAWIRHNIEEVGAFESFLPGLYAEKSDHLKQEKQHID